MKKIFKTITRIIIVISIILFMVWIYIASPTTQKNQKSTLHVDGERLKNHVETLSKTLSPRDYEKTDNLNKCADYIFMNFVQAGAEARVFLLRAEARGVCYKEQLEASSFPPSPIVGTKRCKSW